MEVLKPQRIFSQHDRIGFPLAHKPALEITAYEDLLGKIAELNFNNPSFQLLFRGQTRDWKQGGQQRSVLHPSILRSLPKAKNEKIDEISKRLDRLKLAERLMVEKLRDHTTDLQAAWDDPSSHFVFPLDLLHGHRLVRWAILQHYEVCATPLLDLSTSIDVALSFALMERGEGYIYVLAFPHQTSPVSISLESMTQVVDLKKICPPSAARPHFQSGLLAADYPVALHSEDLIRNAKRLGGRGGDFGARLLAKFHLRNIGDWLGQSFTPIPSSVLFPDKRDVWARVLSEIKPLI